jgi:hypothetical protein
MKSMRHSCTGCCEPEFARRNEAGHNEEAAAQHDHPAAIECRELSASQVVERGIRHCHFIERSSPRTAWFWQAALRARRVAASQNTDADFLAHFRK